jgi:hypothetical protein
MSTLEPRPFATAAATAFLACGLLLTGCTDDAGAARAEADTKLEDLSHLLSLAASSAIADGDTTASLTKVASEAAGVGGTDAQKQAAQRLAAAARSQLAEIEFARGLSAAGDADLARSAVMAQVRAAARIGELAEMLAATDETTARQMIEMTIDAAESAVDEAARAVAELDGPIADLRSLNQDALREAGRLNREANDLRAGARAVGYAEGLPNYRRAIELEQEANGIESQVASRQNELTNQLEPENRLQQTEIDSTRAAIDQLRASLTVIGDRERQMDMAGRAMRDAVGALRADIERILAEADPATSGSHFSAAADHAEAAANAAQRAGRDGQDTRVRAQLMLGQALAATAEEHRAHAATLRQAAAVSALGMGAGTADALERAADEAATAAEAAFAEVIAAAAGSEALAPLGRTAEQARDTLAASN